MLVAAFRNSRAAFRDFRAAFRDFRAAFMACGSLLTQSTAAGSHVARCGMQNSQGTSCDARFTCHSALQHCTKLPKRTSIRLANFEAGCASSVCVCGRAASLVLTFAHF